MDFGTREFCGIFGICQKSQKSQKISKNCQKSAKIAKIAKNQQICQKSQKLPKISKMSKFAKNRKNCQKSAKIAKILKNQKLIKMLSPILPYNFRTLPYPSVHFRTPGSVRFRTLPYARGFNQKSSFEPKVWKTTFFVFFGEKMSPRGDFLIF